jgi:hypothetical protein
MKEEEEKSKRFTLTPSASLFNIDPLTNEVKSIHMLTRPDSVAFIVTYSLQGSYNNVLYSSTLKIEALSFSETSSNM